MSVSNWIELNWIELNWIELNWIELKWNELNWIELDWIGLDWIEVNWIELNWIALNWIELIIRGGKVVWNTLWHLALFAVSPYGIDVMIIDLEFVVGLVVTDCEDVASGLRYSHLPDGWPAFDYVAVGFGGMLGKMLENEL